MLQAWPESGLLKDISLFGDPSEETGCPDAGGGWASWLPAPERTGVQPTAVLLLCVTARGDAPAGAPFLTSAPGLAPQAAVPPEGHLPGVGFTSLLPSLILIGSSEPWRKPQKAHSRKEAGAGAVWESGTK